MRTLAKILRTIGTWLTQLDWGYAGSRYIGPWYYYCRSYYRYPSRSDQRRDQPAVRSAR